MTRDLSSRTFWKVQNCGVKKVRGCVWLLWRETIEATLSKATEGIEPSEVVEWSLPGHGVRAGSVSVICHTKFVTNGRVCSGGRKGNVCPECAFLSPSQ